MTFQHDNRPKHTASAVKAYLHRNTQSMMNWPQHYCSSEVENKRQQTSERVVWWEFRNSDRSEELPGSYVTNTLSELSEVMVSASCKQS